MPGQESRSRQGNVQGSINDGAPGSFVVTFDGQMADEDWYAVTLDQPVTIRRVVFVSGNIFHDGGWFDASAGKPRIQVQREPGSEWETVAEIADYPATVSGRSKPARAGRMKTSHFEGRIALSAVERAQGRDESTQRELATFHNDFGGAWLVPPADCA